MAFTLQKSAAKLAGASRAQTRRTRTVSVKVGAKGQHCSCLDAGSGCAPRCLWLSGSRGWGSVLAEGARR